MVESFAEDRATSLLMTPNKSMTWASNRWILLGIFIVNLTIGVGFALIGGWLILPFAGLEVTAVGVGMYYVCWKLNFKHIVTIEAESLTLQKGVYFPKQEWMWQRSQTEVIKKPGPYRLSAPYLYLKHLNEVIEIADFINRDEKKDIIKWFADNGIPVRQIARDAAVS